MKQEQIAYNKFSEIMKNAFLTRSSVTLARLAAYNTAELSDIDKLSVCKFFIVCKKYSEAFSLLKSLSLESFDTTIMGQVLAAYLRLHLDNKTDLCHVHSNTNKIPRWVKAYNKLKNDIQYPTEVKDIFLTLDIRSKPQLTLRFICAACGNTHVINLRCDLLPYKKETATWLCPHCLANLQWNKIAIRRTVFALYDTQLTQLPKDEKGLLSEEDATYMAELAIQLQPIGIIRFVQLYSSDMGPLCYNPGLYLFERLSGLHGMTLDYVGLEYQSQVYGSVCNTFLATLWNRIFDFKPVTLQLQKLLPQKRTHGGIKFATKNGLFTSKARDNSDIAHNFTFSYPFTAQEHQTGMNALEDMGIPLGSNFICLHVRDNSYYQNIRNTSGNINNYRNQDINTYRLALEKLVEQGYYILRMGSVVKAPLEFSSDHIIDYSTHFRTEFLDIWLFSHCILTITTGSGPDMIPAVLGRDILFTNYSQFGYAWFSHPKSTTLFAHLYHNNTRVPITSLHGSEITSIQRTSTLFPLGYTIKPNTAEEIDAAVQEKISLMHGEKCNEHDQKLQQAFLNMMIETRSWQIDHGQDNEPLHGRIRGNVSSVYLRQHEDHLKKFVH